MKIRMAGIFGIALAVTAFTCITPAQADNYGNYLSSGIAANQNYGGGGNSCGGGGGGRHGHHHFDRDDMQTGMYSNSNSPFGGNVNGYVNTAYSPYGNNYNNNYANNYASNYASNPGFLNEQANLQQQLAAGNLSMRDRIRLQTRLAKLEAKAYNQGQGGLTPFANNYGNGGGGFLSNLRNQYLNNNNNGYLNNGQLNGLASNGSLGGLRNMLGF